MAYNARGEIISMGDPALDISTDQVRVAPIYDPSSFDPIGTARCVRFYTSLAHQEVRRGLAGLREKFERHLNAILSCAGIRSTLRITNGDRLERDGERVPDRRRQHAPRQRPRQG